MSYPDWVPMWLRTAMGRKCDDMAALAVPVTMKVGGTERMTLAAFGPLAWRVPDGCGDPMGEVRMTETWSYAGATIADFVACKHRPNARALLLQSDGVVFATALSFDTRCIEAITAQFPKARWERPFLAEYLCAFDGEPAKSLENLVAIVRSYGRHFDVVSKKRADASGDIVIGLGKATKPVDVSALPTMYDVSCLAKVPTLTATWFGPMVMFDVVAARFRPKTGETFMVAGTRWKASERVERRDSTWIMAHLVSRTAPHEADLDIGHVEEAIAQIDREMRIARMRAKTVSPAERDAKPPAVMVGLPKHEHSLLGESARFRIAPEDTASIVKGDTGPSFTVSIPETARLGEQFLFRYTIDDGATLTDSSGKSVGSVERVPSTLCVRDGEKPKSLVSGPSVQASANAQVRDGAIVASSPVTLHVPNEMVDASDIILDNNDIVIVGMKSIETLHHTPNRVRIAGITMHLAFAQPTLSKTILGVRPMTGTARGLLEELTSALKGEAAKTSSTLPELTSGPTLHIPLSAMTGLGDHISHWNSRIGVAARIVVPANLSIAFVEIEGMTFRLIADRVDADDADIAMLDLVPLEGPSPQRNRELAVKLYDLVIGAKKTNDPISIKGKVQ